MKAFCEISKREVSVASLRLDPNNPRLRLHPGGTSEKELIERLCTVQGQSPSLVIKHLIADRGFLNNEIPVVYKEPGKSTLIVIDGNRRVAALKMVNDLSLVPSTRHGLRSDCESLRGLVPKSLRYWVTSSVSDAKRIVYRAHNEGSRKWETLARYATHYDNYTGGQSLSEIAEVTGEQPREIERQINIWVLYEAMMHHIAEFQIEDEGITNFERITTGYSSFPKRLGIELSPEGIYKVPNDKSVVELIYKAFQGSARSPGFTREVANNDDARAEFWDKIVPSQFTPSLAPVSTKPGAPQATGFKLNANIASGKSVTSPSAPSSSSQGAAKTSPLISDQQILSIKRNVGKKAHAIFAEYRAIRLQGDFPIAAAALTRAMIETTLKYHAKRLNCYDETSDQQSKNFSDSLDSISNKLRKHIVTLNLPATSDLVASVASCTKSIGELNDVMHKDGSFGARNAVSTSLAALAAAVEGLIKIEGTGPK